jgi:choline monooxygenase
MHSTELERLLADFDPDLPLAEAKTIPASWYYRPEIAQEERVKIFGDSWQFAARTEQLQTPGQFVTIEIAGEPVLIVRDKGGNLLAMANVCRHRAARIETRAEGTASRFRCRYHGWAYALDGRLAGTPDFEGVANFCKEESGLPRYHVDQWGPLVFVHLGKPKMSLAEFMRPVTMRSGQRGIDQLKFGGRRVYEMKCNWKIFCDNYLDGGYHIPTLHPDLAKLVDMDTYHTILDGEASLQMSPLKANHPVRSGEAAHYWWLYPNFMINIYDSTMDTNVVLPLGPDRCLCIFDFFFAETAGEAAQAYIEQSLAVAHQVQLEDQDICEEVQRGLQSTSYDTGRFSVRREAGGYHFHQLLARGLRSSTRTPARDIPSPRREGSQDATKSPMGDHP